MVILFCISLLIIIISIGMAISCYKQLDMNIPKSIMLGILMSIPFLFCVVVDIQSKLGVFMIKIACLLGGEEIEELQRIYVRNQMQKYIDENIKKKDD